MQFDIETDYCVIGAGAAGCVIVDRLSERGRDQVLLLEAGPRDWHPYIHIPSAFLKLTTDPRFSWNFRMEPEAGLNGRSLPVPQGKMLGGSSSINGMVFMRGQKAEYDSWAAAGCTGWSYEEVLPYFKRIERADAGADAWRGREGPMRVTGAGEIHTLTRAFVAAGLEAGFPAKPDLNGPEGEGIGLIQNNRDGRFRAGSAQTYLRRAKRRPNVRIETHALATRLIFEDRRAIGVEFTRGGTTLRVRARREVVLCGGALKSPQLLQLSGIGAGAHLQGLGIPVRHELPGVGLDLRDHLYVRLVHRVRGTQSINERTRGWRLGWEAARYVLSGKGMLSSGATSGALFCRSAPEMAYPDLYITFLPGSFEMANDNRPLALARSPGMSISVVRAHPDSRGMVLAKSPDPLAAPAIQPNYLSEAADREATLRGLAIARRLFAAPALARFSAGELTPGPDVAGDKALLEFARERGSAGLHFTGTCRMGTDPMAVVAPDLKVRGIDGLRVIDASVMPGCSAGNSHAPTLMVGEKGADLIRSG